MSTENLSGNSITSGGVPDGKEACGRRSIFIADVS